MKCDVSDIRIFDGFPDLYCDPAVPRWSVQSSEYTGDQWLMVRNQLELPLACLPKISEVTGSIVTKTSTTVHTDVLSEVPSSSTLVTRCISLRTYGLCYKHNPLTFS